MNSKFTLQLIVLVASSLVILPLAGCGASFDPYTAGNTKCLNTQLIDFQVTWSQSLAACGTKIPDLTGDAELQTLAKYDHIRFTIDPLLDKKLKEADQSHRDRNAPYVQFSALRPPP